MTGYKRSMKHHIFTPFWDVNAKFDRIMYQYK